MAKRFVSQKPLMSDIAWLDPRRFPEIKSMSLFPAGALSTIAQLANIHHSNLCRELLQFAWHYKDYNRKLDDLSTLAECLESEINATSESTDNESEPEIERGFPCSKQMKCQKCLVCTLQTLYELNLYGEMYPSLYIAYKYILTLSCTQVSCERVFSVLKIIKNRLRSLLGQELLEDFILLYVHRNYDFDYNKVIDDVANSSAELARNLKL